MWGYGFGQLLICLLTRSLNIEEDYIVLVLNTFTLLTLLLRRQRIADLRTSVWPSRLRARPTESSALEPITPKARRSRKTYFYVGCFQVTGALIHRTPPVTRVNPMST